MKKIMLIIAALATCLAIGWMIINKKPAQNPLEAEVLVVGTNSEYPPFSFIKNNQLDGFEIDIAKEVARRLGKTIAFKDMAFTTLIPELQAGNIHLIAAGMTPSPERAKRIGFTKPHISGDPLVIVSLAQHGINNLDDLRGKDVIVNEGYVADSYMTSWNGANLTRLTSPADAFLALKSGRAVAYVDAQAAVNPFFERHDRANYTITRIPDTASQTALGVPPQFPEFKDKIQSILDSMEQDGTINTLKQQWGLV